MRMLIGQLLVVVQRYPALVDGAFIIIAWVGIKLLLEYLHQLHYVAFEIPKWLSLGLIVVIFGVAFWYAPRQGPIDPDTLLTVRLPTVQRGGDGPQADEPTDTGRGGAAKRSSASA